MFLIQDDASVNFDTLYFKNVVQPLKSGSEVHAHHLSCIKHLLGGLHKDNS